MEKKYVIKIDFDSDKYGERDMDVIIYDMAKFLLSFSGIWDIKMDKAT